MLRLLKTAPPDFQHAYQAGWCVSQAQAASGAQAPNTASAADDESIQAVVAALRQAKLQCQDLPDPCSDITNTRAAAGSFSSSSSDSSSSAKAPDLGPLLELYPAGISSQFVQHCLQDNLQGDMQVSPVCLAANCGCQQYQGGMAWCWATALHINIIPVRYQTSWCVRCRVVQAAANWLLEADIAQLMRQQQAWEWEAEQREVELQEAERQKRQQEKLLLDK